MADIYHARPQPNEPLDSLIAQFLQLEDTDSQLDPEEFVQRHSAHKAELRRFFDNVAVVEELAKRELTGNDSNTREVLPEQNLNLPAEFGRYRMVERIGGGAMGDVYLAHDPELDRHVALKVPRFASADFGEVAERFRREARTAAGLRHPNICPVHDVGAVGGRSYISMAFIRGHTLKEYIDSAKPQPQMEAALTIRKLALALAEAHRRGIIHRDLKSANIMVDEGGEPIVMDFGLARMMIADEDGVTHTGAIVGTPAYMSPEQVEGDSDCIGPATDIYGLGIILYELVTGRLPFTGSVHSVLKQVTSEEPPRPARLRADLDPVLEAICLKAIEKSQADRYRSMDEFADDLLCFVTHKPTVARPPGWLHFVRRRIRRNPIVSGLTALAAVTVVLVVLAGAWAIREQRTARAAQHMSDRQSVRIKYNQALNAGDQRGPAVAILKLAEALEEAVNIKDRELELSIRRQLGAWQQELPSVMADYPHSGHVFEVAISSDSQLVLTSGDDGTAKLWNANTAQPAAYVFRHDASVYAVDFSPDDGLIVTGSGDFTAQLWETHTGRRVGRPLMHDDRVLDVAFSPNGAQVLTASEDHTARLWDNATQKLIGEPLVHPDVVRSVVFSPDGTLILTGCDDGRVRVWDPETLQETGRVFEHRDRVFAADFSPDGSMVLTGCDDSTAQLWDLETGDKIGPVLQHLSRVAAVDFSPDGKTIMTSSLDCTVRFWDRDSGRPLRRLVHPAELRGAVYAPDGRSVISGCWDGAFRRWREVRPARLQNVRPIRDVRFDIDGHTLATCDSSRVQTWHASTGEPAGDAVVIADWIPAAAISPDTLIGLVCSEEGTAQAFNMTTGAKMGNPLRHDGRIRAAEFSPNSLLVATGSDDKTARIWTSATGEPAGPPLLHAGVVTSVAFSSDGQRLLTASADKTVRQWSVTSGVPIGMPLQHGNRVYVAAYNSDSSLIATASLDGSVRLWNSATCQPTGLDIPVLGIVRDLTFSPDGRLLVTGGDDRTVCLWDIATGQRIGPQLRHPARVEFVVISPDGRTLLSRCQDTSVWLRPLFPPVEGAPDEVMLWAQVISGMELDGQGNSQALDWNVWKPRQRELAELQADHVK